jgi:hypothetical protein
MSCPCTEMSARGWLHVTETCSGLYIIVVFWPNDILISTTAQRDGCYQFPIVRLPYNTLFRRYSSNMLWNWAKYTNKPTYFLKLEVAAISVHCFSKYSRKCESEYYSRFQAFVYLGFSQSRLVIGAEVMGQPNGPRFKGQAVIGLHAGPAFAHGTTGAKRIVGAPPPPVYKHLQKEKAKLCNIVTATSLLN